MPGKSRTRALLVALVCSALVATTAAAVPALAAGDPGTITGHFTDGTTAIVDAAVAVVDTDQNFVAFARTGTDGAFFLAPVPAGDYKLYFQMSGGFEQWARQKRTFAEADLITVTGGLATTVDEQVRAHGSLSGHITNADGTPAAFAQVRADLMSGEAGGAFAQADASGFYSVTYLDPGDYRVSFQRDFGSPGQYANNVTSADLATPIPVSAGVTTTLDQTLLAVGRLTGQVTNGTGGVAGVQLSAYQVDGDGFGFAFTNSDGSYVMSLLPGTYTVQFLRPDNLTEYAPRQIDQFQAGQYVIVAGADTVLNERLRATGTVSGRLTMPNGDPVANAGIEVHSRLVSQFVMTDDSGFYQTTVYPGSYSIAFNTPYGTQWTHGRPTADVADSVSVIAGATVTVDEVLAPFGSLVITARNQDTGAVLSTFCVFMDFFNDCTQSGTITLPQILPGRYRVGVFPQDTEPFVTTFATALVSSGATSSVELSVPTSATVSTVMTDARTGAPVANACLQVVNVLSPNDFGAGPEQCSDSSGAVVLPQLRPGSYKAFVWARDGVHGHQWVGPSSGVGKFKKAVTITLAPGQQVTLPAIKLDLPGTISGTLTDEITGAAITQGFVGLSTFDAGRGDSNGGANTDRQGHYTLTGLGPYNWTLFFTATRYAAEWSGDSAVRDQAAGIRVRAGATSTYDTALGRGTTVSGRVFGPTGVRADEGRITVINADSGDEMGSSDFALPTIKRYVVQVKGPQRIKLEYYAYVGPQNYAGWFEGTGFSDAAIFRVPAGGEKRINVTVTQTNP
jgi:hypothetical protein